MHEMSAILTMFQPKLLYILTQGAMWQEAPSELQSPWFREIQNYVLQQIMNNTVLETHSPHSRA